MQKILTVAQMRAADEYTIKTLGIPSRELMARAGRALAEETAEIAAGGEVLVVCGSGNNGGDGYVCAQELLRRGYHVKVYACGDKLSPDCEREKLRYTGKYASKIEGDVIVDCLFGTGLGREVTGEYARVIDAVNACGAYVISADIPSGMSGDGGIALGRAVRADKTVAMGELKMGFALSDGFDLCGTVVRRDIGIRLPEDDYASVYEDADIKPFFPPRSRGLHKGSCGTAGLVCGSARYPGSAVLAVSAALKSGCGYVKVECPDEVKAAIAPGYPQAVFVSSPDFSARAIAVGPGCGVSRDLYDYTAYILKEYGGTLIIDADGLNSLAGCGPSVLADKKCTVILTPHVKEFSRISGRSTAEILADPVGCARSFAGEYNVIVLLKGPGTVITDGTRTAINVRGCSALAKAGSGDMLTGFMCGTVARGLSPFDGAVCAAHVMGAAAELAAGKFTEYCVTSADILSCIPEAVKNMLA